MADVLLLLVWQAVFTNPALLAFFTLDGVTQEGLRRSSVTDSTVGGPLVGQTLQVLCDLEG